jgi:MFS family permease
MSEAPAIPGAVSGTPDPNDAQARRNVLVLVAAQAILGAQMPMIFTTAGLIGLTLSPNPCFATMPISMAVLASMLAATPISSIMQRHGRAAGFRVGTLAGAAGGAFGAAGIWYSSFTLFLIGAFLSGFYMSAQGFYRFAAADTASADFRPKAISWVMAGGLLAAIIGPQLVNLTDDLTVVTYFATFLAIIVLNAAGSLLFARLDIPTPPRSETGAPTGRSRRELFADPTIRVAMICGMVSYALMNLVMTSAPLAIVGCGFDKSWSAHVVSAHVLAMYAPSFFTGHLIARFGARAIVGAGLVILAAAGVVALTGVELFQFFGTLILLGIGWNFGFIGATTLLTTGYQPHERGAVQGMNDAVVFGGVFVASLSSGALMSCSGADVVHGWDAVNIAMLPFLTLAGASLIWLWLRPGARMAA